MATKKQKREAALAKRAKFMEEQQALGLAAQQRSLEERDAETERICNEIKKRDTSRMDALAIALTKLSHN